MIYTRPDVDFLLTNKCENRCKHCAFSSGLPLDDELSFYEVVVALQKIREIFNVNKLSVSMLWLLLPQQIVN